MVAKGRLNATDKVEATETAKNRAKQIEEANSGTLPGPDGARIQDLEIAREQYMTMISELDAAKQELRKVHQKAKVAP
ncbi:hypothetical protein CCACVL1_11187 [Corchorus capsularis]|uniref:Uncharacterized protein n=1 Tax=Corchorus capsularis TaxID=210143 RepID=A0A1R3IMI7_COCAP|nr:hypothetical protein CCACVL1_11187 [Corchorus capsularis]